MLLVFVSDARCHSAFKLLIGRLCKARVKTVVLVKNFGVDRETNTTVPSHCRPELWHPTPKYGARHDIGPDSRYHWAGPRQMYHGAG